jgi:hypothetical protein
MRKFKIFGEAFSSLAWMVVTALSKRRKCDQPWVSDDAWDGDTQAYIKLLNSWYTYMEILNLLLYELESYNTSRSISGIRNVNCSGGSTIPNSKIISMYFLKLYVLYVNNIMVPMVFLG